MARIDRIERHSPRYACYGPERRSRMDSTKWYVFENAEHLGGPLICWEVGRCVDGLRYE